MSKLTLKQQRFVTEYLKSGNATDAAAKAGYSDTSRNTLGQQAFQNLRNPNIQNAIAQALTKAEITPEYIILRLNELSHEAERDSDKLRALEDLAKIIQLSGFGQDKAQVFNGDITISFGSPSTSIMALPSTTIIDVDEA